MVRTRRDIRVSYSDELKQLIGEAFKEASERAELQKLAEEKSPQLVVTLAEAVRFYGGNSVESLMAKRALDAGTAHEIISPYAKMQEALKLACAETLGQLQREPVMTQAFVIEAVFSSLY